MRLRAARLSACFVAALAEGGTDLRGPMRSGASDEDLREFVARVWRECADRYSGRRSADTDLSASPPRSRMETEEIGG